MNDKVLHAPPDLDLFPSDHPRLRNALSRRVNADPESVEKGLAQLVLTIVELLRQLMERQALRRIDGGSLSEEQVSGSARPSWSLTAAWRSCARSSGSRRRT
jgi:hypothetical protein